MSEYQISDDDAYQEVINALENFCPALQSYINSVPWPKFDKEWCSRHGVEGRCLENDIYLHPGTPHLTIAHEVSHWILHKMAHDNLPDGSHKLDKIYDFTLSRENADRSPIIKMMMEIVDMAERTPEITNAKIVPSNASINVQFAVRSVTRPDEILANALSQFVIEKFHPVDLEFLVNKPANALQTEGYWHEASFRRIRPLVSRLAFQSINSE
jgi:hypothetical protein